MQKCCFCHTRRNELFCLIQTLVSFPDKVHLAAKINSHTHYGPHSRIHTLEQYHQHCHQTVYLLEVKGAKYLRITSAGKHSDALALVSTPLDEPVSCLVSHRPQLNKIPNNQKNLTKLSNKLCYTTNPKMPCEILSKTLKFELKMCICNQG